ncbi:MAG: hypothetical protein ACRDQH_07565, partial [Pseudonocardiaceae bacterium]
MDRSSVLLDLAKILHVDVESLIGRPGSSPRTVERLPRPGLRPVGHDPQEEPGRRPSRSGRNLSMDLSHELAAPVP